MSDAPRQTAIVERVPVKADNFGLVLTSLDDMYRYAKFIVNSPFKPKGLDTAEAIVVAIDYGASLGLPALQAIQNIAVINGRPCVWGDVMLAICQRSPVFDHSVFSETVEGEGDKMVAHCTVRRKNGGESCKKSFSWSDATKARLTDRDTYKMYPKRMLQMRARAFALRDTFADVLKGLYAREELDADAFEQSAAVIGPVARPALTFSPTASMDAALGLEPEKAIADSENETIVGQPCGNTEELPKPDGQAALAAMRNQLWGEMKRAAEIDRNGTKATMTIDGTLYDTKKSLFSLDMPTMVSRLGMLKAIGVNNG